MLSRLLERQIVTTYIYPALSSPPSNLCFTDQFAFRPTGSTNSALIYLLHTISEMLASQPYVRVIALDFSKAFDTVRHSMLLAKLSDLSLPDNIYNWITQFLCHRSHCTKFDSKQSAFADLTASVVQGSAIGPAAYTILASDLRPITAGNEMAKFADDTYLIVPANLSSTIDEELIHIEKWSTDNNLKLNRTKSYELIFTPRRTKTTQLPPPLPGVTRVKTLKCLGVTLSTDFSFTEHISDVIASAAQSLYALDILRAYGLQNALLQSVFNATALAKLRYSSPAWWGFATSAERDRLEAVLRKATRCNFYSKASSSFELLCDKADSKLFKQIISDPAHVLHRLLPRTLAHGYDLRKRKHNYYLPRKNNSLNDCNFLMRMLYKDCY